VDLIDPALHVSPYNQRLFVKESKLFFFPLKLSDIHEVPDVTPFYQLQGTTLH